VTRMCPSASSRMFSGFRSAPHAHTRWAQSGLDEQGTHITPRVTSAAAAEQGAHGCHELRSRAARESGTQGRRASMRDAQRVQVRQRTHDLGGVHARKRLLKDACGRRSARSVLTTAAAAAAGTRTCTVQLKEEVSAVDEVEDEVQLCGRLRGCTG
jgi:hypothetical protein